MTATPERPTDPEQSWTAPADSVGELVGERADDQVSEAVDEQQIVDAEIVDAELVDAELVDAELVDAELVDAELVDEPNEPAATGPADESPPNNATLVPAEPSAPAELPGTSSASLATAATTPLTSGPPQVAFDYTDAGVPTLDYVRNKIEQRLGTAEGHIELNDATDLAQQQRDQQQEREKLAQEKLAELRRQVSGESQ